MSCSHFSRRTPPKDVVKESGAVNIRSTTFSGSSIGRVRRRQIMRVAVLTKEGKESDAIIRL